MAGVAKIFDTLKMAVDPLYNVAKFPFPGKCERIQHGSCKYNVHCQISTFLPYLHRLTKLAFCIMINGLA